MKLAIMQPYFLPYVGYFQLINSTNQFVIYDNIKYTKKGWINRNRILVNSEPSYISLALKKDSDLKNVDERELFDWNQNKKDLLNRIIASYNKSPYYKETIPLIKEILDYDNINLFIFLYNSVCLICNYLDIQTPIIISSLIDIDHSLKCNDKVLAICKEQKCKTYINAIGGQELYTKEEFLKENIELKFIKTKNIVYQQFNNNFQSNLSIIDVLMFCGQEKTKLLLNEYDLI